MKRQGNHKQSLELSTHLLLINVPSLKIRARHDLVVHTLSPQFCSVVSTKILTPGTAWCPSAATPGEGEGCVEEATKEGQTGEALCLPTLCIQATSAQQRLVGKELGQPNQQDK